MTIRTLWMLPAAVLLFATQALALDILCDTRTTDCRQPIINAINAETDEIDVAFWFMEDARYVNALVKAKDRGVRIRVLVDPRANATKRLNGEILDSMQAAGFPMRYKKQNDWGDILHWKMFYFASQGIVQFSAANFSPFEYVPVTPMRDYIDEIVWLTDDIRIAGSIRTKFDDFWTDTVQFGDYANINGPLVRSYPISPLDPAMNFAPFQDYATRAVTQYNREPSGANGGKIDVVMYRMSDARHADGMIAAVKRGIPVRLITEPENYRDTRYIWHSYNVDRMYMAGVQVKDRGPNANGKGKEGITHEKAVILYGQQEVIFGGSNWSSASSNQQYEHNIFARPCTVVTGGTWCDPGFFFQFFVNSFEKKWNSGSGDPTLTDDPNFAEFVPFQPLPGDAPINYKPANGAANQPTTITLDWDGGNWNHKYDVYLGTDPSNLQKIASDLMVGSPYTGEHETWKIPTPLEAGKTYYWRVVGKTMANLARNGPIWSFTTGGVAQDSTPYNGTPAPIPGTIQAENFDNGGPAIAYVDTTAGNSGGKYRQTDVDIATTTDTGGGFNLGYTAVGEWLKYTVKVASTGSYSLKVRYANNGTGAAIHVEVDGNNVTGPLQLQNTGGWQVWQDIEKTGIALSAGQHVVRLVFDKANTGATASANINSMTFTALSTGQSTPFVNAVLPGAIEAENFDNGGEGVAYHDTTSGNSGGKYRSTDVDIANASDTGGGYNLGYVAAGEWLKYTVNVQTAGAYPLTIRYANNGSGGRIHINVDDADATGPITLGNTGGWQTWSDFTLPSPVNLTAGKHVLTLVVDANNTGGNAAANINRLTFGAPAGAASTPFKGTPALVPGTVQAEDFDNGGEGVAYHDTTSGNSGGKYRTTNVDIASTSDAGGGYNLGYATPGEWLNYTINVAADSNYTITIRYANNGSGASVHFKVDGVNVTGSIAFNNTGGWQNWQEVTTPAFRMTGGNHVLTLVHDTANTGATASANINWLAISDANVSAGLLPREGISVFGAGPSASDGVTASLEQPADRAPLLDPQALTRAAATGRRSLPARNRSGRA